MRGMYNRDGELFGYLQGSRIYDLDGVQTGVVRGRVIFDMNGDRRLRIDGDALLDIRYNVVGYLGDRVPADVW